MGIPFRKMHGLGNDFVVFDARTKPLAFNPERARRIADRRTGIGCDQLIIVEASNKADAFMRIYNQDGGEVEACGNATRCVGQLLGGTPVIDTLAGPLSASPAGPDRVAVDMGLPRLAWHEIPVAQECDTLHLPLSHGPLADPVGTNMGNPHATFFVDDLAAIEIEIWGPQLENDEFFPARANIGIAEIVGSDQIRLRVWERGVGLTLACGTGACAALVAASRRGLVDRRATMILDGGELEIEWRADGHVIMTGPVATSFSGELSPELAAGLL